ncbi:19558_t:CDS:2, partial [Racocetra fulgida]
RSQALAATRSKESDKSKTTNVKTTSVKTLDNSVKTTSVKTTNVKILDNSVESLKQQALDEILKSPKTDSDIEQPESTLVLQVEKNKNLKSKKENGSDLEAFRREVASLPDE